MTSGIEGVSQSGVITTQVTRVQNDRPAEPPKPVQEAAPPPPPPPESGRGTNIDTSA